MTGAHGGCCCNHDDPHDNKVRQDESVHTPQILMVADDAGCCGDAKDEESSRTTDHAGHSTATASPS